jgi:hypothetical protein
MSIDDLEKKEEEEFRTGPLSVLTTSVKTNTQVNRSVVKKYLAVTSLDSLLPVVRYGAH